MSVQNGPPLGWRGFTLIELLVVIGILGILLAMLMPTMARARQHADILKCKSNLRQVGVHMELYSLSWRGWLFPPGLGRDRPPELRWPVQVFKPAVHNPAVLLCPLEFPPVEHSYILNDHLTQRGIRRGSDTSPLTPSEVIVAGEKSTDNDDYYLQAHDYPNRLDLYRHGIYRGANYLFFDLHVETHQPEDVGTDAPGALSPWDVPHDN